MPKIVRQYKKDKKKLNPLRNPLKEGVMLDDLPEDMALDSIRDDQNET